MSLINATYLVRSKYGVYSFRWSVRLFNIPPQSSSAKLSTPHKAYTYKQVKISLQTKDYLEAVQRAYPLYTALLANPSPTYLQVKELFRQHKSNSELELEALQSLSSVKMEEYLRDLSYKSCNEYMSCWNSFLKVEIPREQSNNSLVSLNANSTIQDISTNILSEYHIELWKKSQICAPKTLKKKLRILSSCFSRASIPVNQDWFRLRLPKKDSSNITTVERRAFSDKEVQMILRLTEKHSERHTGTIKGIWKYYLPRLALVTGCRLNELAQLRVGDVRINEKQPYISINADQEDKKIKNLVSKRDVPMNDTAIELCTALVNALGYTREVDERVFPDLPYSKNNGYVNTPSKWFSNLCRDTLKLEGVSFHSFRHYVITKLFNAEVQEELIASIVGHSTGKMTTGKIYMNGFTYANKLKAIQLLELN